MKHFNSFNTCKFGDSCAYRHDMSKGESDYKKLVTTVSTLQDQVKDLHVKITNLENELKSRFIKEALVENKITCDKCKYTVSSNSVLKRHNSMKHKKSLNNTPEKMRQASHDESLQLSPISDDRSDEITSFSMDQVLSGPTQHFKCEYCDTTTKSKHALKGQTDLITH